MKKTFILLAAFTLGSFASASSSNASYVSVYSVTTNDLEALKESFFEKLDREYDEEALCEIEKVSFSIRLDEAESGKGFKVFLLPSIKCKGERTYFYWDTCEVKYKSPGSPELYYCD